MAVKRGGKAFCCFVTIYAPTHFTSLKNMNDTQNGSLKEIIIHLGTILFLHHYYYHFPIITILFQCTEETFGSDMRMTGSLLCPPNRRGGGHIVFGADPVCVCVRVASFPHVIF